MQVLRMTTSTSNCFARSDDSNFLALGLSHIVQETAMVNHECDMLMHDQPVTQRPSEVLCYHTVSMIPWYPIG